jgi:hypothetical protein
MRIRSRILCICILTAALALLAGPAGAQLQAGVQALQQDRYEAAEEAFERAALEGDAKAMFNLGLMAEQGLLRGEPDYLSASSWYRAAANKGDPRAQYNFGLLYMEGKGFAQNYRTASEWFHRAADGGSARAMHNLGIMYYEGLGRVRLNYGKSRQWFDRAAKQGFVKGRNDLDHVGLTHTRAGFYMESSKPTD